jgi:hypothetical protein
MHTGEPRKPDSLRDGREEENGCNEIMNSNADCEIHGPVEKNEAGESQEQWAIDKCGPLSIVEMGVAIDKNILSCE